MRLRAEDRLGTLKVINRAFAGGPAYQELFKQLLNLAKEQDSPDT
jgi:hypothetical protein